MKEREEFDKSSCQFQNRLFDRDTLWLAHYDINFLYVLALYAGSNEYAKKVFREDTREKFREHTMKRIGKNYQFHVLKVKRGYSFQDIIDKHFRKLYGKIFCPYRDSSLILLALDKHEAFAQENEEILQVIDKHFHHEKFALGGDPHTGISSAHVEYQLGNYIRNASDSGVENMDIPTIDREDCKNETFLIGCIKNEDHLKWMCGYGKKPIRYNIRYGQDRDGAVTMDTEGVSKASFLVLYDFMNEKDFAIYRITNHMIVTKEATEQMHYPTPQSNYILYELGEQVSIDRIDVAKTYCIIDWIERMNT